MTADNREAPAERKRRQAASFGAAAALYERARPTYPDAALDWLLPPYARRVLDLGAGTGKLTRSLAARRLDVVAVDPSREMLDQLSIALPGVPTRVGGAEAIPLVDACVDAVVVAQAWHWVDPSRAVPEVARVLRPGGAFGLLWNARDDRVPWVALLNAIIDGGEPVTSYAADPVVGDPFAPLERLDLTWSYRLDEAGLLDLVASRSFVITLHADARAALLDEVRALFATLATDDTRSIALPYVTRCFRTIRRG